METKNLLKRRVLRDDVAEYLMESILKGDLNPGDKIVESKLARELSISQGAVREAIRDLIAQGVLETEPYKGTRIRTLTKDQLNDYYDVRTEIEALAVRWSIVKHESKYLDLAFLKSCVDNMQICVDKNDSKNMRKHDMAFHLAIVQAAHSESLEKAWNSLGNYYWTYIAVYYDHAASLLQNQIVKHQTMYEAIAAADINAYASCVRGHYFDTDELFPEKK
ncbi:DNA-binding GntR family transcriptional regulator [Desulfomicrobium macestii]|uniref:Transcriptional regulator, GntR family n=2 Tax=Desulfomicrobium TaxID=898 RepID=A0A8G2BZ78_DESNO|nr:MULTISPECIES: GntR family transcriptional regulator [Desulfomicrobium]MBE1423622.1 DNA-binding GntR family transcriptional regulator [Desulfomicrobium macestii]SFL22488.1 transcriptional regulator, GntR family [Desulfomicrobium norvegicum]